MPTVLRWGSYRAFFYSNEGAEPAHVHVREGNREAKFWLADFSIARNIGFTERELKTIIKALALDRQLILEKWNEHFGI